MRIVFNTATTANGFLADEHDSLDWLFAVQGVAPDMEPFVAQVGAVVMGAATYRWVLRHERLVEQPEKWQQYFGSRPVFVFSHRDLPVPSGADVRVVAGPVRDQLGWIASTAGDDVVWLQGGGDLVGQFLDIDALDEIILSVAPAMLASGRPLLPRNLGPDRLDLVEARQVGQFAQLRYIVRPRP